eukprot:PhF_6_TR22541/c0_g1_i2/m.32036
MNATLAAQRQVEVHGVLRNPITSVEELKRIHMIVKERLMTVTFPALHKASRALTLPLDFVFQFLLHRLQGSQIDFDAQHGDGFVPMHQAKVLDRSNRLPIEELTLQLSKVWTEEEIEKLCQDIYNLRTLFRMKVEDANDLSMAHKTIGLTAEFLDFIAKASQNEDKMLWGLYSDSQKLLDLQGESNDNSTKTVLDGSTILQEVPLKLVTIDVPVIERTELL